MARKETMAERKYCKMKKDIHPEYRPVVFMGYHCSFFVLLFMNQPLLLSICQASR